LRFRQPVNRIFDRFQGFIEASDHKINSSGGRERGLEFFLIVVLFCRRSFHFQPHVAAFDHANDVGAFQRAELEESLLAFALAYDRARTVPIVKMAR
jgi:hypothetical protein